MHTLRTIFLIRSGDQLCLDSRIASLTGIEQSKIFKKRKDENSCFFFTRSVNNDLAKTRAGTVEVRGYGHNTTITSFVNTVYIWLYCSDGTIIIHGIDDFKSTNIDFIKFYPACVFSFGEGYFTLSALLHSAALKGDWEAAEKLLNWDRRLINGPITGGGETALHIAAMQGHASLLSNLLGKMEVSDVEILNQKGCTALSFAAAENYIDIARQLVEKNRNLPKIGGCDGAKPLLLAARQGHTDMANYLFSLSGFDDWTPEYQSILLTTSISSGLYGLAMDILRAKPGLAVDENRQGERPLEVLAGRPSAFCGNSQQGLSSRLLSLMKWRPHNLSPPCNAYTLFDCLWKSIVRPPDIETGRVEENTFKALFIAAKWGNCDFLVELIRRYPDFLYKVNDSKYSIFHIAVSHRHEQIFNLIHELRGLKDLMSSYIDEDGNNMLHLAAKLAPQDQLNKIPGAALQMQREVLWYKEVEKIVHPSYRIMKNSKGQKPLELFLVEHENLMKEGEKQMKQTAKSCMLVTMLIATVVFTAAFTVPGGYNNDTGVPILENERLFVIFPIAEAVATLSSLASMLTFLSMLTSRYAEDDFLTSLPFRLVFGVMGLFVSVVAMMVAFLTSLLFYQHGLVATTILLVFFTIVALMYVTLNYRHLVSILRCTCGCRWLFRSNNRLFS